jgi:hypothetical protein
MLTRGIIGVLALSACAAAAVDVAVGPAVGYGTPVDDRALTQITPHGYGVWKVDRDFNYGLSGAAEFAPFELSVGAGYFSAGEGRDDKFSVEDLKETGWRSSADFKYIHSAPPLNAALRAEYGRAEIKYEMGPAPGATPYGTVATRYTCDLYSLAATLGPRLKPWDWLQADLAVGPGLKIVRRNGESFVRQQYLGPSVNPIGYEDRLVELHYASELTVPVSGRFGLQLSVVGITKLAELRDRYPQDGENRFYAALSPVVVINVPR